MPDESLKELLVDNMKDMLDAEKQITRALPKMARKASSEELRAGLETHLRVTEEQIERLNQAFELLGEAARGKKCPGMQGLIEEGSEHMQEHDPGAGLDAVIIASAQKVEHYEMAAYGTMRTWATQLGLNEVAGLFEQTLEEEKMTDQQLTDLAESMVNPQAAGEGEDEDEEESEQRGRTASRARTMAAEKASRAAKSGSQSSGGSRSSGSRSSGSRSSSSGGSRSRKRSR
jgi:ferritin-like metal-binding protein YciE